MTTTVTNPPATSGNDPLHAADGQPARPVRAEPVRMPVGDHPPAEVPGWLAGGYEVVGMLGDGPFGPVVLARAAVSGRPVAIRVLPARLAADEVTRGRFLRAAELACRLSHPNVVRILAAGIDERPFVVMEHVDGETLADRVARAGGFPSAETFRLAIHLAAGLAHAHASGVVHGGVDAASILLGHDGVARLTGFGLTRLLADATGPAADDDRPVRGTFDTAGDVYALGAALRRTAGEDLPPDLATLVDAALAPVPADRPTAVDLHHQLLTLTGPPGVWLPPAVASTWNAVGCLRA
ncbi:MAG: protein kinase [Actinobacteria bacterium]|nr:protein kinase [Actinomycetota bacterium]